VFPIMIADNDQINQLPNEIKATLNLMFAAVAL
jgi:hypothetical protein